MTAMRVILFAGVIAALGLGCDRSTGPTPAPVFLRQEQNLFIGSPDLVFLSVTAPQPGKLQIVLDWENASNQLMIVGIAPGTFPACMPVDFRADPWVFVTSESNQPCPFLTPTRRPSGKPATLTTVRTSGGSYTVVLGNRGPSSDLLSVKVILEPEPVTELPSP
jgi:hypothetical protein